MRTGKYLNSSERFVIEVELAAGSTVTSIARKLGRARCTIHREIARGMCQQLNGTYGTIYYAYKSDYAQLMADRRQEKKGRPLKIGKDHESAQTIENFICKNHWSPAAALGYAKRHNLIQTSVSVPTLYSYIHTGVLSISDYNLPRQGRRRKAKQKEYRHAHRNLNAPSIEERPKEVLDRQQWGHWEGDLIVGAKGTKTAYLTLLERKTRYVIAMRIPSRKKQETPQCLDELETLFGHRFNQIFKTITFDNGIEFSDYQAMETSCLTEQRRTRVYFAHPYCSSERGSNENCNGLLRRAGFTKSSDLGSICKEDAASYIAWVNNLPRAILDFQTAREAFEAEYINCFSNKMSIE